MDDLVLFNGVMYASASRKMMDGREHMVVPVVALVEGVLNEIYYSEDEINSFSNAWNGVPVPVEHPKRGGKHVSANAPEFEEKVNIGRFYNVKAEGTKLKGEIWLDVEKATRLGYEDILSHFDKGKMMEVSTGLLTELHEDRGVFNGKSYKLVAKNIRPDHLALLPNEIGACSIHDGCGAMRVHKGSCCEGCEQEESLTLLQSLAAKLGLRLNAGEKSVERNQSEETMTKKTKTHEEMVDALIANEDVDFSEDDKASLLKTEKTLITELYNRVTKDSEAKKAKESTEANESKEEAESKDEKVEANEEEAKERESVLSKLAEVLGLKTNSKEEKSEEKAEETVTLTKEQAALFNRMQVREEKRIKELRTKIGKGYPNLSQEIVDNMDVDTLEAMEKGIKPAANYGAKSGSDDKRITNTTQFRKARPVLLAPVTNEKEKANG